MSGRRFADIPDEHREAYDAAMDLVRPWWTGREEHLTLVDVHRIPGDVLDEVARLVCIRCGLVQPEDAASEPSAR